MAITKHQAVSVATGLTNESSKSGSFTMTVGRSVLVCVGFDNDQNRFISAFSDGANVYSALPRQNSASDYGMSQWFWCPYVESGGAKTISVTFSGSVDFVGIYAYEISSSIPLVLVDHNFGSGQGTAASADVISTTSSVSFVAMSTRVKNAVASVTAADSGFTLDSGDYRHGTQSAVLSALQVARSLKATVSGNEQWLSNVIAVQEASAQSAFPAS